ANYLCLDYKVRPVGQDENPRAWQVYNMLAKGKMRLGASVTVMMLEKADRPDGRRLIKKVFLIETSLVGIPANQLSWVQRAAKAFGHGATAKPTAMLEVESKAASGATNLPLSARDAAWDSGKADAAMRKWAGGPNKDKIDWGKYRKGFFWYDSDNPEDFASYKLPFAQPVDGKLTAVWKGVTSAAAAVQGARGGVKIPDSDKAAIKKRIAGYYAKARKEFEDDTITPPWEASGKSFDGRTNMDENEIVEKGAYAEKVRQRTSAFYFMTGALADAIYDLQSQARNKVKMDYPGVLSEALDE